MAGVERYHSDWYEYISLSVKKKPNIRTRSFRDWAQMIAAWCGQCLARPLSWSVDNKQRWSTFQLSSNLQNRPLCSSNRLMWRDQRDNMEWAYCVWWLYTEGEKFAHLVADCASSSLNDEPSITRLIFVLVALPSSLSYAWLRSIRGLVGNQSECSSVSAFLSLGSGRWSLSLVVVLVAGSCPKFISSLNMKLQFQYLAPSRVGSELVAFR